MAHQTQKPRVQLVGRDGNAFAILGACQRAAKAAGWTDEEWQEVHEHMTSADYNHLLATAMEYFEVH